MAAELRARRPDSRVVLRVGVSLQPEPETGRDERGRHAIAGPAEWVLQSLLEYVETGCDGFVATSTTTVPASRSVCTSSASASGAR